jgi:transposase
MIEKNWLLSSSEVHDTCADRLPRTTPLHLETWHLDNTPAPSTLLSSSTQGAPRCPGCHVPARHVHSRYPRTLADRPWRDYQVTWRLRGRTRFCRKQQCPRRVFTARLSGVAAPWARRTLRRTARLLALGLARGGAAGARLSQSLGFTASRNTLLRVIRRASCPAISPPRILSVDEFALRQRHSSGPL